LIVLSVAVLHDVEPPCLSEQRFPIYPHGCGGFGADLVEGAPSTGFQWSGETFKINSLNVSDMASALRLSPTHMQIKAPLRMTERA